MDKCGAGISLRFAGSAAMYESHFGEEHCVGDILMSLAHRDCFIINQGKLAVFDEPLKLGEIYSICPRLRGGKGGFGSMLRAIGAQIEKTTNREACRDLSGRRMRDVNNEKRMVEYMEKKAEEERERAKKKMEKLERLTQNPKHLFNDPEYDTKVHETVVNVDKAVEEGILAHSKKRKLKEKATDEPQIKKGLWLEEDEFSDSDDDSDSDAVVSSRKSENCPTKPEDGASTSKCIAKECDMPNEFSSSTSDNSEGQTNIDSNTEDQKSDELA